MEKEKILEREKGFEPSTLALARRCSTTELFPLEGSLRRGTGFYSPGDGLSSNPTSPGSCYLRYSSYLALRKGNAQKYSVTH